MSVGQAVGGVGGAIIGFFLGGPAGALKGAYWGYMAGSIVDPQDLPTVKGPRLQDLKAQSSVVGAPIPMLFGTYAISGNVIWADDLVETKHKDTVGGKGGPSGKQITYTYSQSFAIGLCEAAIPGTAAIQGIRKVWANGKLIYDRSKPTGLVWTGMQTPPTGSGGNGWSSGINDAVQNVLRNLTASDALDTIMTVYDGTQTAADPTIEAIEGVGMVPVYKDLAYVVFDGLQLEDYGNRAPELLFEVYTSGTSAAVNLDRYANEVLYPWILGALDPVDPRNVNAYSRLGGGGGGPYSTLAAFISGEYPGWANHSFGYKLEGSTNATDAVYPSETPPGSYENVNIYLAVNYTVPVTIHDQISFNGDFSPDTPLLGPLLGDGQVVWWSGNAGSGIGRQDTGIWYYASTGVTSDGVAALGGSITSGLTPFAPNAPYYLWRSDFYAKVQRSPSPPPNVEAGWVAIPDVVGYYVTPTGDTVRAHNWVLDSSTTYKVLQNFTTSAGVVTKYPVGPARPLGHSQYSDSTYWTDAYNAAVAAGTIAAGKTYGVDYPQTQSYGYKDAAVSNVIDVFPVPLDDIVSKICQRSGMSTGQIDVTDINSFTDGYAVGGMMDGRAAINPLMMFGLFGAFEADGKIIFRERGAALAVTFSTDELRAHAADSDAPSAVEVTRKQDVELPRAIRVSYGSPDLDYQPGEQQVHRVTTTAVNSVDVQLPLAMTDTKALQLAEVYMFDSWTARNGYTFSVSDAHLARTPTDVVGLPVDGNTERVRIMALDTGLPGVLKMEAIRDDVDVLTSYATRAADTAAANATPSDIVLPGPTDLVLLDVASLRAGDNDAGYYAAGRGYLPTWSGFSILQSFNGGTEYTTVATSSAAATLGKVNATFTGGSSTIQVTLDSGTFAAATSGELDAGANLLAVGAHGRWELLQFGTASLSSGVWTLGSLRRGLRGTSAYEATNVIADRVVLVIGKGILRIPLAASLVNVAHLVKGVSLGTTAADTVAQSFTSTGKSLQSGGLTHDANDNIAVNAGDADTLLARQVFGP